MKKIFRILATVSLALLALSCAYEPEPEIPASASSEAGLGKVSIDVTWEDVTKAGLGSDRSVTWAVGDEVAVYDATGLDPRKFTVVSVTDKGAVIDGYMNPYATKIWAVRPFSAANFCLLNDELRLKLPDTQVIPAGGNVDPAALISVATCAPGEALHFRNAVSLVKFDITRTDVTSVVIAGTRRELLGGTVTSSAASGARVKANTEAEVTITPASGAFAPGTYYATVFPASLPYGFGAHCYKGTQPVCSKTTGLAKTFARNGSYALGDISTLAGLTPTIYEEGSYADVDKFASQTGYNISSGLALLKMFYLANTTSKLYSYKFTYPSVDPSGNPTTLSGVLYIPQAAVESGAQLDGLTMVSHPSVTQAVAAPSRVGANLEGLAAWVRSRSYAVVFADNYGLGASERFPQAYLDAETIARGNLDALAAAKQLLSAKGIKFGDRLVNFGYSQGGYGAIATLKYVSQHPETGVTIAQTIAGAGPYDINLFYNTVKNDSYPAASCFFPVTIVSANECGRLGLDYADLFQEPLRSHVDDWILSKENTPNRISSLMGTTKLSQIVTAPLISQTGPAAASLIGYFTRNDLTAGWTPAQGSKIYLFHSSADDIVPTACSDDLNDYLTTYKSSRGLTLTYDKVSAGGHNDAVIQFATNALAYF